jgi:hypothetical protein
MVLIPVNWPVSLTPFQKFRTEADHLGQKLNAQPQKASFEGKLSVRVVD